MKRRKQFEDAMQRLETGIGAINTELIEQWRIKRLITTKEAYLLSTEYARRLENRSRCDKLTGVYNPEWTAKIWHDALDMMYSPKRRQSVPHSIIYVSIDVDGLRAINNTYLHNTGDQLLVAVADTIRKTVRVGDTVGRLHGDEFAVLIWNHSDDCQVGKTVAERLRKALESKTFTATLPDKTTNELPMQASVGYVCITQKWICRLKGPISRIATIFENMADRQMYEAKRKHHAAMGIAD